MKEKFLLHVCCAPCAAYAIQLLSEKFTLVLYFYNPNIQPESEYQKRLGELINHASQMKLEYIIGDYQVDKWQKLIAGRENDPERGERCRICYKMRLKNTGQASQE